MGVPDDVVDWRKMRRYSRSMQTTTGAAEIGLMFRIIDMYNLEW